mmetsp:Transcript_62769/g.120845  ORF Transcript_62769/g.120845 Transcript_62769/m.120845 type:complete len:86 (+) Transcript_62769:970-1227(+)
MAGPGGQHGRQQLQQQQRQQRKQQHSSKSSSKGINKKSSRMSGVSLIKWLNQWQGRETHSQRHNRTVRSIEECHEPIGCEALILC